MSDKPEQKKGWFQRLTSGLTRSSQAMTEQVAAFIANPAGWPAAMAARALRLRAGHPAYSPNNHALIVCQLWGRFAAEGLSDEAAFDAAIRAAAETPLLLAVEGRLVGLVSLRDEIPPHY